MFPGAAAAAGARDVRAAGDRRSGQAVLAARDAPRRRPGRRRRRTGVKAAFDRAANKITLSAGDGVTLTALSKAVGNPAALQEANPGEWLLGANLEVVGTATLARRRARGAVAEDEQQPAGLRVDQGPGRQVHRQRHLHHLLGHRTRARSTTSTRTGGRSCSPATAAGWTSTASELRYLGHSETESYGLSWRLEGSGGSIKNSIISHLYFGLYSFEVGGLEVLDNEVFSSVVYGIDPHTGSHDMKIQRNVVHDNGKHGIILAEDCVDSVISDNVVYRNQHHGIVLYLRSDRNTIENNETFDNLAQGININESLEQRGAQQPGLQQHRVRRRRRPERHRQPGREERDPRQRAGRGAAGQRHLQGGRAGQRDRRERALRGLHRRPGPVHAERQHDLRQPGRGRAQRHLADAAG